MSVGSVILLCLFVAIGSLALGHEVGRRSVPPRRPPLRVVKNGGSLAPVVPLKPRKPKDWRDTIDGNGPKSGPAA